MKTLRSIDCQDTPGKLKAGLATKFIVRELSFVEWVSTLNAGSRSTTAAEARKAQRKVRRDKQISALNADGQTLKIENDELLRLPRSLYAKIMDGIDDFTPGDGGEVIVGGDGIDRPIVYRFGTPLKIGSAEGDLDGIAELEFSAKTGADIEDVLAEPFDAARAVALIEHCAKPLTKDLGLLVLPSWALDQITLADGVAILEKVLPSFLG
jgi:hypothetical protein